MKRLVRATYALALFGLIMLAPVPAQAMVGDCKDAPVAEAPGGGMAGMFATPPAGVSTGSKDRSAQTFGDITGNGGSSSSSGGQSNGGSAGNGTFGDITGNGGPSNGGQTFGDITSGAQQSENHQHNPVVPPGLAKGAWVNGAPVFAQYNTAGLTFHTYDLGCVPNTDAAVASFGTMAANWMLEPVKFGVVGVGSLTNAAYHPTFLSTFDPMLRTVTHALEHAFYDQWAGLVIAVVGIMLIWKARKLEMASAAVTVGWAVLVMVLATAVFSWPVRAGSAVDATLGSVLGGVNTAINGQSVTDDPAAATTGAVSNAALFQEWKMGTFGRANSATANKYAKAIYTNQALTWREAALKDTDPAAYQKLLDDKASAWEDAASKIKDEDPDAYEYLIGHHAEARVGAAFTSIIASLCTLPFPGVGDILMIGAYLILRLAVMFFPIIATIGIAHSFRGAVKGVANVCAAAVVNVIMFGVGGAVTVKVAATLLSPGVRLPLWLSLALMGVFSVVMWVALKPARKLTTMASPDGLFKGAAGALHEMAGKAKDTAMSVGTTAVGAAVGYEWAMPDHKDGDWADPEHPASKYRGEGAGERTELHTAPAPTVHPPISAEERGLPGAPVTTGPIYVESTVDGLHVTPAGTVGAHRADVPVDAPALPAGSSSPLVEGSTASHTGPDVDSSYDAPFMPGAAATGMPDLPSATEPSIDVETGEAVYDIWMPDEVEAGGVDADPAH